MQTKPILKNQKVLILGMGLMGGSLAAAIKPHCQHITAYDPDAEAVQFAVENGIIDSGLTELTHGLPQCDLIVLAAPISANLDLIARLDELHAGPAVVMDMGSTKQEIMTAMQTLPERFDPVGGHPMCGKENNGVQFADARMFRGHPFIITPLPRTSKKAVALLEQIVELLEAREMILDGQVHDSWTGQTSHLAHMVACSLVAAVSPEAKPVVGTGFRSTARLAKTSTRMLVDMLMSNRQNVLDAVKHFNEQLAFLTEDLEQGNEIALYERLAEIREQYSDLVEDL